MCDDTTPLQYAVSRTCYRLIACALWWCIRTQWILWFRLPAQLPTGSDIQPQRDTATVSPVRYPDRYLEMAKVDGCDGHWLVSNPVGPLQDATNLQDLRACLPVCRLTAPFPVGWWFRSLQAHYPGWSGGTIDNIRLSLLLFQFNSGASTVRIQWQTSAHGESILPCNLYVGGNVSYTRVSLAIDNEWQKKLVVLTNKNRKAT